MRGRLLIVFLVMLAGCGRLGYDSLFGEPIDGGMDPDASDGSVPIGGPGTDGGIAISPRSCPPAGCALATAWTKSLGGSGVD